VLGWPREALSDPDGATLAHGCPIERRLGELHDPLPTDRINILPIIARPYGDRDVGYHALVRPLVERVQARGLPVRIDVLRPPTFDRLQARLRQRPGFYHIVRFDGHGGYAEGAFTGSPHLYGGAEGWPIFETEAGGAAKLTLLLGDYRVPVMVLNACRSARIDDPFASVAAALLKAGIRAVVAMGWNLYVSAARQSPRRRRRSCPP
jgi:hypothetical protein